MPKQIADIARAVELHEGQSGQKGPLAPQAQGWARPSHSVRCAQPADGAPAGGRHAFQEEKGAESKEKNSGTRESKGWRQGGDGAVERDDPLDKIKPADIKPPTRKPLKRRELEFQNAYQ